MPHNRTIKVQQCLGFGQGPLPFTYLGVPIFIGKPRTHFLQPIADKIKAKLVSWKGKLLSIMGRAQLINSFITSMLLYSFQVYAWPVSLLKTIESQMRNFLWSGDINTHKLVTVAWSQVCKPLVEGGLGLKSIVKLNEASMLKLMWDFVFSNSHWVVFMRAL